MWGGGCTQSLDVDMRNIANDMGCGAGGCTQSLDVDMRNIANDMGCGGGGVLSH